MQSKELNDFCFTGDFVEKLINQSASGLFINGRKFRSHLIELTGDEFGLNLYQLAPYQRVIEMVHNATLVHDDIIDKSDFRRGTKTLNSQLGDTSSVLVGDYILSRALYELSTFAPAKVIKELTISLKDLVDGELLQNRVNKNEEWDKDTYFQISRKKTGSLLKWSLVVPALITDQDESTVSNLRDVANELGDLYQIMDDVLDFDIKSLKQSFLDLKNWNINYVLIELKSIDQDKFNSLKINRDPSFIKDEIKLALDKSYHLINEKLNKVIKILNNDLGLKQLSSELKNLIIKRLKNHEQVKIYS